MAMRMVVSLSQNVLIFVFLSLCFCNGEDTLISEMEKVEQEALYSVIQGLVGKWWNGSDLYPDPCGWTPIQGVSCELYDSFWHVTVLKIGPLFDNFIMCAHDAQFPDQLFKLRHLKVLSISNCFLSFSKNPVKLPNSKWEKFSSSLESLEFRSNAGLGGAIPSSIGLLGKLQSLVLLENGLTGELPSSIANLVKLRQLVLAGNHFVGGIPIDYGSFSELLIFDASRNNLSGPLPSTIGFFDSLLKLDLSDNMLEGELPRELGSLKNLQLLDLSHNKLTGGLAGTLQKLVSIQDMVISNNPVGGDLMGIQWELFQNMETLDLSDMGLTGSVPESMAEMKRLRHLELSNNNISGSLSGKLEHTPCLRSLHLNGNKLAGRLEFSASFYRKMGRRFAAWNNPNLCYIPRSMLTYNQMPYGVKPCVEETSISGETSNVKLNEGNYENSNAVTSSGRSCFVFHGILWIFSVNGIFIVFLRNMSL